MLGTQLGELKLKNEHLDFHLLHIERILNYEFLPAALSWVDVIYQ